MSALTKLVTSLKETDSLSTEHELGFLQSLLASKELNALVSVHSKVAKVNKDERLAPLMSTSLQVRKHQHTIFIDEVFFCQLISPCFLCIIMQPR